MLTLVNEQYEELYLTDCFKPLNYPLRTFCTLAIGCVGLALVNFGVCSLLQGAIIVLFVSLDEIIATPIVYAFQALNNIKHDRKVIKAYWILFALGFGLLVGGVMGFWLLTQIPLFAMFMSQLLDQFMLSPMITCLGALIGLGLANLTEAVSKPIGFGIGMMIGMSIPLQFPLMIEVIGLSMLTAVYLCSVICKQSLRLYYWFNYGHSNADGYQIHHADQKQFNLQQAKMLGMKPERFEDLAIYYRARISLIKKSSGLWRYFSFGTSMTNALKDMYHALMHTDPIPYQHLAHLNKLTFQPQPRKKSPYTVGFYSDRDRAHQRELKNICDYFGESRLTQPGFSSTRAR